MPPVSRRRTPDRRHEHRGVVTGIRVREGAVVAEHAVERRQETVLNRAAEQTVVDPEDDRRRAHLIRRLSAPNMPITAAASSAAGDPLPATSPTMKPNRPSGEIDVVEEVAADGQAGRRRAARREERAVDVRRRQQRSLNGGGDFQFLLELRFVERLAIEPRVFDRERRFRREHLERRPRRDEPRAPRSRLSRYSTPMICSSGLSSARST